MKKISLLFFLIISLFSPFGYSQAVDFGPASKATSEIKKVSMEEKGGSMEAQIENTTLKVFKTLKITIGALLVVYLVYAGSMMIISMGSNESQLSDAKRSTWYAILGLLFINIPGTLYSAFSGKRVGDDITSHAGESNIIYQRNIFINSDIFGKTLGSIITFLEIGVVSIAIFIFTLSGIKIMMARGDDEVISENKKKILYSLAGLIFIGVIEVWRNIMFKGDFKGQGKDLFGTLANLALFFAGPIAIFFLSMAGYYYITSGGDEEKVKKAKSIVFNTLLATVILLGIYTFLIDLKSLSF